MNLSLIIDFVIAILIAVNAVWGYKKGLTHLAFKFVISIASIVIVVLIYKPVSNFVFESTDFDENLTSKIETKIGNNDSENGSLVSVEVSGAPSAVANIINTYLEDAVNSAQSNVVQYVSVSLAKLIIQVGVFIALYIVIRFALSLLKFIAESIAKLPILNAIDKSGGFIYGLLKGLLIVFIILTVISLLSPIIENFGIIASINNSYLGSILYSNNIVLNFINKIL